MIKPSGFLCKECRFSSRIPEIFHSVFHSNPYIPCAGKPEPFFTAQDLIAELDRREKEILDIYRGSRTLLAPSHFEFQKMLHELRDALTDEGGE